MEDQAYAVHFRGTWYERIRDYGFVVTEGDYAYPIALDKFEQFLMIKLITGQLHRHKSLVFVGCSGTLSSFYFQILWRVLGLIYGGGNQPHTSFFLLNETQNP